MTSLGEESAAYSISDHCQALFLMNPSTDSGWPVIENVCKIAGGEIYVPRWSS